MYIANKTLYASKYIISNKHKIEKKKKERKTIYMYRNNNKKEGMIFDIYYNINT